MADMADYNETNLKFMTAMADYKMNPADIVSSLNKLADEITCGDECQRQRIAQLLLEQWNLAKTNFREAPERLKQAEKNYIVNQKGLSFYNNVIYDRHAKNAKEFKANSEKKFNEFITKFRSDLDVYRSLQSNFVIVKESTVDAAVEYVDYQRQFKDLEDSVHTNARKAMYEEKETSKLYRYRYIILFIYYAILILYLVFGNFFADAQYANISFWIFFVFYAAFPWTLNWIVRKLFAFRDLLQYVFEKFPYKNAYVNI